MRNAFILLGVFILGAAALTVLLLATSPRSPAVASTAGPETKKEDRPSFQIDPGGRYDVYCSFRSGAPSVYRDCTFLGFTDRGLEIGEPGSRGDQSGGSSYLNLSSSSARSGVDHFQHWLVIRLNDGRKSFLPPSAVLYFEEAQPLPVTVREAAEAAAPAK